MKTIVTILLSILSVSFCHAQGLTLPYTTGFDSPTQKAGWQQFRLGNDPTSYSWSYAGGGFSATCVSHDYNVGASATDTIRDWFVSPPLNITTPSTLTLKVKTGGFSTPFPDSFEVLFSSKKQNPASGNYTVIANLSYMLPQYQWLDTVLNIPTVTDSGYIAFKYKTISAAWSTYAFDNIMVAEPVSVHSNAIGISMRSYPNPLTSETTINTSMPLANATITVYNNTGELVKQLDDLSGQKFTLHRDNLSNGIYYLRLIQDNKVIGTNKLIILN
jgi:hypothetical protein